MLIYILSFIFLLALVHKFACLKCHLFGIYDT